MNGCGGLGFGKVDKDPVNTNRSIIIAFSALVLVLSLACAALSPSAGPAGSPPPTQSAPPILQPTLPLPPETIPTSQPPTEAPPTEPPPTVPAPQYFTEEFDTNSGYWTQKLEKNSPSGDLGTADLSFGDGNFIFDLGKWLIAYLFYDPYEYDNVRVDVRVNNRGTNVNNILLVCRASEEGLYLVNIANSGLFAMYALEGETGVYTRMADGGSNKIRSGKEVNEYSLRCSGRTLTLYINGNETRSYTDNRFALREGKVGVGVASEDQLPVKVEFEWVDISEP